PAPRPPPASIRRVPRAQYGVQPLPTAILPPPVHHSLHFYSFILRPPRPPLFPYTTLFRSPDAAEARFAQRHERALLDAAAPVSGDRKSTSLNSSHGSMSYAVFCLKKKCKHLTIILLRLTIGLPQL